MIGKNYNKTYQGGQVLLITVMLLATAITIVMTIAFNTTTETQIVKLEQESQKALSAAEAGLEVALQNSPGSSVALDNAALGLTGITGQADVLSATSSAFISPFVQKDEQYTFYLANYQTTSPAGFVDPYFSGDISFYFGEKLCESGGTTLEITQVMKINNALKRYLIDPCGYMNFNLASQPLGVSAGPFLVENTTLYYKSTLPGGSVSADTKLLIVRVLYNGTKIIIEGPHLNKLPLQGKTVVSTAKTETGVTKRIQLFQSYPQIPTDFFVTGF